MTRLLNAIKVCFPLALGLAACSGPGGGEQLYVLRDSLGRAVATAGRSQLADAPPGSMARANIGGVEQEVMVGESVGFGPVMRPSAPRAPEPVPNLAALPAGSIAAAPLPPIPVLAEPSVATAGRAQAPARTPAARQSRTVATATGANPSGRRREAPPRAISRSVM